MNATNKAVLTLSGIALTLLLGNSALAAEQRHDRHAAGHRPAKHSVDAREHHQRERVEQGVRSGQLTRSETKKLVHQQREIRQEEKAYRSDGKFTKEERKDIQHDLNRASKNIREEKHDAETRK